MAYAPLVHRATFAQLAVPPSQRLLARTLSPYDYDPQLEGFFDVVTAPFRYGAKAVSTAAKGAYQAGRYAVKKVPQAAVGFATGGPAGAAIAVGGSIASDLARRGGGQPGTAGAYSTEFPPEVGYGPNTQPAYSSGAQGYGTPATGQVPVAQLIPRPAIQPAGFTAPRAGGVDLMKLAPFLIVGGALLLKKR